MYTIPFWNYLFYSPLGSMPNVVALGTKDSGAGGFDDYGGKLELHRLDFLDRGLKCPIVGSVKNKHLKSSCIDFRLSISF